ncbi:MAG: PD-(D/E)XK nuclease family protein [Candidatus Moranbacteria bacterium]|nr:PD-(D/E)XK nuclease family protein [Candidatus Moranbacteria bacterium]
MAGVIKYQGSIFSFPDDSSGNSSRSNLISTMKTSYSALDTFLTCPLKYKFSQIDRIKTPKSKEQVFGTLIHGTMKLIHTPGIISPTLEQALDFFSKNWNAEVFTDEIEERSAFSQGVSMIQDYYKKNDISKINIVDLESYFQIEVEEGEENHIVSGIIDRIDKTEDGYEIIDYKTAKKLPSQEKVDSDLQLSIYLSSFLRRYPKEAEHLDKIKVSLYYLKHGVKLSSERSLEQVKKSEELIVDLIGQIKQSKFEPKISGLCDWCGYQKICPMWKHKFREKDSEEIDIEKIIEEFVSTRSEVKSKSDRLGELQEIIGKYMDQKNVEQVFADAGSILRTLRKTYRYDAEKLREILEPLGKWEEILKVDGITLRKVSGVLPIEARREIDKAKTIDKESKSYIVKKG